MTCFVSRRISSLSTRSALLKGFLNVFHRAIVLAPAVKEVINRRKDNHATEHDRRPVHLYHRRVRYFGEGEEDQSEHRVEDSTSVDDDAAFSEIEARRKKRFSEQPLPEHTGNTNNVGNTAAESAQGYDDVEGDWRADDDETDK